MQTHQGIRPVLDELRKDRDAACFSDSLFVGVALCSQILKRPHSCDGRRLFGIGFHLPPSSKARIYHHGLLELPDEPNPFQLSGFNIKAQKRLPAKVLQRFQGSIRCADTISAPFERLRVHYEVLPKQHLQFLADRLTASMPSTCGQC